MDVRRRAALPEKARSQSGDRVHDARDRFGALLSLGVASVIAIQVILNVAVVTGSIPPTGLPLPFISAGSTSLVVFMSAIGVVLNINKQSKT